LLVLIWQLQGQEGPSIAFLASTEGTLSAPHQGLPDGGTILADVAEAMVVAGPVLLGVLLLLGWMYQQSSLIFEEQESSSQSKGKLIESLRGRFPH
jgi:hypothetical protein